MSPPDNGYRDRLVTSILAAAPALVAMRCDEVLALLIGTTTPSRILVLAVPEDATEQALRSTFDALLKAPRSETPTHVVVVGGGAEVTEALRRAGAPPVQIGTVRVPGAGPAFGLHHVDARRQLVHVGGPRLDLLAGAVESIDEGAPFDSAPIASALARGQAFVQASQVAAARLSGRSRVTLAIMAICVLLSLVSAEWGPAALRPMGADNGDLVRHGEVWRLFASAFLHAGWLHLGMNMYALWIFGPLLETVLGPRRYVLLYGASALGGALASALLGEQWSVGASGAIWGLMAAGMGLAVRPRGVLPAQMAANMRRRLATPLVINLLYSFSPGIDMRAHIGGGVVGFLLTATVLTAGLTPLSERATPADAEESPGLLLTAAAVATAAAMALSIVVALATGRPWEVSSPPVLTRTAIGHTGLTLDLPSRIAGAPTMAKGTREGTEIWSFGTVGDAPVVFEIIVAPLSEAVAEHDVDAVLDEVRQSVEEHAPSGFVRRGPATRVTVGRRPAVLVEHTVKGIDVRTYFELEGAFDVFVRGYASPDRPSSWAGVEANVAASLASDGQAR